jgi:glycosyltransferase involved in cell wall biosynthesis
VRIGIDTHAAERTGSGNCSYIRGLVRALVELDRDTEYVLYANDEQHPFYESLPVATNVSVRRLWPAAAILRVPLALAWASYRDRLDVLHVQYSAPPRHRGSLVLTIHDLAFLRVPWSFPRAQRWRLRTQLRATIPRVAAIITVSQFSKRELQAVYGLSPERITVVHDAPAQQFTTAVAATGVDGVRRRLGIRHPYVLSVGRQNPRKNVLGVLRAFERVRSLRAEPLQLVVVGPPDYRAADVRRAVERSPDRAEVICAGLVDDADMPALFSGASVFLYPSFYEGFGLPVVEAMACGTPVITSRSASLPEVVGDAAVLVDPMRQDDVAAALLRVLDDAGLRASLAERGPAQAATFRWEAAARRTIDVYRLAASPGVPPAAPSLLS